jgi:hypothetical protein
MLQFGRRVSYSRQTINFHPQLPQYFPKVLFSDILKAKSVVIYLGQPAPDQLADENVYQIWEIKRWSTPQLLS